MQPRQKVWIVFKGGTKFGAGRARLLRLLERHGSLKQAVAEMGMSYRAAWGYLRELEDAAGFAFVERAGPGPSSGQRLTREGADFVARFERLHASTRDDLGSRFQTEFADACERDGAGSEAPRSPPSQP